MQYVLSTYAVFCSFIELIIRVGCSFALQQTLITRAVIPALSVHAMWLNIVS